MAAASKTACQGIAPQHADSTAPSIAYSRFTCTCTRPTTLDARWLAKLAAAMPSGLTTPSSETAAGDSWQASTKNKEKNLSVMPVKSRRAQVEKAF